MTTDLHPDGWIFDVHGRKVEGADLDLFTGYGHYARRDFTYDNGEAFLHAHLVAQGLAVRPGSPNPGDEVGATTSPANNLISGGRYGASYFSPTQDPIPRLDNVTPTALTGSTVSSSRFRGGCGFLDFRKRWRTWA
ncbi:hypothetical protein [Kocuria rosea]|uniref:hypothetical protein n=1 Tax=Kocuria rosea TaxID=1275 RepID=UPI000F83F805|nr:hypothetical protein [Kocuria rosea]